MHQAMSVQSVQRVDQSDQHAHGRTRAQAFAQELLDRYAVEVIAHLRHRSVLERFQALASQDVRAGAVLRDAKVARESGEDTTGRYAATGLQQNELIAF